MKINKVHCLIDQTGTFKKMKVIYGNKAGEKPVFYCRKYAKGV